jgi:hypothetical protein
MQTQKQIDEWVEQNKEHVMERRRLYRLKNKEKLAAYYKTTEFKEKRNRKLREQWNTSPKLKLAVQQWRSDNKEHVSLRNKKYNEDHREEINQKVKERIKNDPSFKVSCLFRNRLHDALKAQMVTKEKRSQEICGCTWSELKEHLEKQFKEGMTWDNHSYYGWHIDHIKPCASFDLTNQEELLKCFHYTNLQPLWAKDNLSKGCK